MIWDKKICPICDSPLKVVNGFDEEDLYLMMCPTSIAKDIPVAHSTNLASHQMTYSHFELEFQNHQPSYQTVRVYPYCVKSYVDVSNIYMYRMISELKMYAEFVVETPFIDLPWKDKEKIIAKLSTYTLFS